MSIEDQVDYLMQGTRYGDEQLALTMRAELAERLIDAERTGRPLRVYCGFDPRTSDLHIGHTVPIRKLRAFQELGHDVVFLVGTFTSRIGDPSDKNDLRKILSQEEAVENGRTYAEQACRILDRSLTEVRYNHEWLAGLSFEQLIDIASNFTLQQFLTRENFKKRSRSGDAVFLHETFYALMQAYDAFYLDADVQVGGTDQLFNIITASRKLMTTLGKKPNIGIIHDILPGTDGEVKMSKSLGNHISIMSDPGDMFGKIMSIPDKAMPSYFRLATPLKPGTIETILEELDSGMLHPRDAKIRLAREIVTVFCGASAAVEAEAEFRTLFQSRETPDEMDELSISPGTIVDVIVQAGLVEGRAEIRRLISQGAVRLDDTRIDDHRFMITAEIVPPSGAVLRVGKRRFSRVYLGNGG